ncbi:hypothetical protein M408DRAFT_79195 [Serendipita vermifera MAFF 305830]|uniref:F-box domain-containing protein n=1 Tax=Serendipita vermifera MAFF 305830 TaxID=933852 RepID=A0A0C2W788_SERVB|nr:hypothetical protein M408DRAFT_79195 [Serendipita vermifera MAFF 305830]
MEAAIDDLRSTLSPIGMLPSEILTKIFEKLCNDEDIIHEKSFPVILSSVCSRWRSLVTANSSLWKHVIITTGRIHTNKTTPNSQLIKMCMERGRHSPQTLLLDDWSSSRDSYIRNLISSKDTLCNMACISFQEFLGSDVDWTR